MIKIRLALLALLMFGLRDSSFCADTERIAAEAGKPFGEERRVASVESAPIALGGNVRAGCCAQEDDLEVSRFKVDYLKNDTIPDLRDEAKGHRKSSAIFGVAGLSALSLLVAGAIAYHPILQYAGYAGIAIAGLGGISVFANMREGGVFSILSSLALLLAAGFGIFFPAVLGSIALGVGAVAGLRGLASYYNQATEEDRKADEKQEETQELEKQITCIEKNCGGAQK